jgi:hypothetical protein
MTLPRRALTVNATSRKTQEKTSQRTIAVGKYELEFASILLGYRHAQSEDGRRPVQL